MLSINMNGLRLRQDKIQTCLHENNIDVLCLQDVHSFNEREMHEFEKKARGVGFFDTKGGYTGTGVIVRQSLQNMGIEHVKIDNPSLENRVTHLKITSNETFHILSVYGPPNRTQKSFE